MAELVDGLARLCVPCAPTRHGVVADATPGVSILDARRAPCGCDWALCVEAFDEADFGLEPGDAVPDISLDPEDLVLTVINASPAERAYHVSLRDARALGQLGSDGDALAPLPARDNVSTFSLALAPRTRVDVCVVDAHDVAAVDVASDVVDVVPPPRGLAAPSDAYAFPLRGGPFLCTQGAGGLLSHYAHASTSPSRGRRPVPFFFSFPDAAASGSTRSTSGAPRARPSSLWPPASSTACASTRPSAGAASPPLRRRPFGISPQVERPRVVALQVERGRAPPRRRRRRRVRVLVGGVRGSRAPR